MVDLNVKADITVKVPGLNKLLDYTASGIGAVAAPMLAPYVSRQQAKAKLIEAKAEADSLRLIAQAQADARKAMVAPGDTAKGTLKITREQITQRLEFQEQKRQRNIAATVAEAAAELGDKTVSDHEPDHDWTARFFGYVQDVSSADIRRIWAKILAGEVQCPGGVSLRTLSILRNMPRREAELFTEAMRYRIDDFILRKYCLKSSNALTSHDLYFTFENMGLFYSPIAARPARSISLGNTGITEMVNADHILFLKGKPNRSVDVDDKVVLKTPALELAPFCGSKPDMTYLRLFAEHLASKECSLAIAPIEETTPDGYRFDHGKIRQVP